MATNKNKTAALAKALAAQGIAPGAMKGAKAVTGERRTDREWLGQGTGLGAARLWIALFQAQRLAADTGKAVTINGPAGSVTIKRPLTDDGIAALMVAEYGGTAEEPVCRDVLPGRIAVVRSLFNNGRLRPQQGQRPAVPTGRFDEEGNEAATSRGPRAGRPAAKEAPAAKGPKGRKPATKEAAPATKGKDKPAPARKRKPAAS